MKIYTKRGDTGNTDLFGGERVLKNNLRVKAYGEIDCANSFLGLAYSTTDLSARIKKEIKEIMHLLFAAGAEVATAPSQKALKILERDLHNKISSVHTSILEKKIDEYEKELNPLKNFILPSGSDASSRLHCARSMVRKSEIALIDLIDKGDTVREELLKFFNRLSDFLFVLARLANRDAKISDVIWVQPTNQTD